MGWLLLCLHLLLFHFPSFSSFNFSCHRDEYYALLHLKSAFTIDPFYFYDEPKISKIATWKNGTDCCSWQGVTCDTISGHVIDLNLENETLQGEVPPQISHLSKLTSLHLSHNSELIWKESTLKRLVQNATNLRELFLNYTNMSSIRQNSIDLIFNHSSSLVTLDLTATRFRGNFKQNILCLPGIQELYMSENDFSSQIPELSCSKFLRILDFSSNGFQGPIPPSFSNLTYLTSLTLNQNTLNCSIPSSLLILPSLTFLHLSDNNLSGQIPNVFHQSNQFQDNNLSGQIPNVFHQSNQFQELDLRDNEIGGELPISLSNLRHLINLDLSGNSFKGGIPDVFGGMTKLQQLNLGSNNLEGQIPSSLFNLNQLLTLDFSDNKLVSPLVNKFSAFLL